MLNGPRFASFRFEANFFYETGTLYRRVPSIYVASNINAFETKLLAIFSSIFDLVLTTVECPFPAIPEFSVTFLFHFNYSVQFMFLAYTQLPITGWSHFHGNGERGTQSIRRHVRLHSVFGAFSGIVNPWDSQNK
jgi:hypothetical protein